MTRMIVCGLCGNKRCPHGTDHRNDCTASNEPGQTGSRYGGLTPSPATPDADDASTVASDPTDEWPLGDQHGYDVALCICEGGSYLGARQMGQPCCCELCGRLTRDQWDYLVSAAATRAADDRAERAWDEGHRQFCAMPEHYNADHVHLNLNPYRAARIARTTP